MNHRYSVGGADWDVYDFIQHIDRRQRVIVGDRRATARAFVPAGGGTVMIYQFGLVAYHDTQPRTLEQQLKYARPLDAPPAQRLNGGPTGGSGNAAR